MFDPGCAQHRTRALMLATAAAVLSVASCGTGSEPASHETTAGPRETAAASLIGSSLSDASEYYDGQILLSDVTLFARGDGKNSSGYPSEDRKNWSEWTVLAVCADEESSTKDVLFAVGQTKSIDAEIVETAREGNFQDQCADMLAAFE